jgi:hypothetical protein
VKLSLNRVLRFKAGKIPPLGFFHSAPSLFSTAVASAKAVQPPQSPSYGGFSRFKRFSFSQGGSTTIAFQQSG